MTVSIEARRTVDRERQRRWRAANGDRKRVQDQARYEADSSSKRASVQRRTSTVRLLALHHYGTTCGCCGTDDDLTIDHVRGDGAAHRKRLSGSTRGGGGTQLYAWLRREGFPEGFQTLCRRCNRSKGNGPRCFLLH